MQATTKGSLEDQSIDIDTNWESYAFHTFGGQYLDNTIPSFSYPK